MGYVWRGQDQLIVSLFALLSMPTLAQQGTKPAPPSSTAPIVPSCAAKVKAAHSAGFKDGFDAGSKVAPNQCAPDTSESKYLEGTRTAIDTLSTDLKSIDGKTPMRIVVEDIPGADSYRLAAAEVINTYFARHFVVSAEAPLYLHIGGTDGIGGAVAYSVSLKVGAAIPLKRDNTASAAWGTVVFADEGGVWLNYSEDKRTQAMKETIYSVLSRGDGALFPPSK
jgi:hypothetical protein